MGELRQTIDLQAEPEWTPSGRRAAPNCETQGGAADPPHADLAAVKLAASNIEDASQQAVIAAMHGDLPALAAALQDRAQALAAGQTPSVKALQDGEDAKDFLEDYIRNIGLEAARVKQMQTGFSAQPDGSERSVCVNFRG